MKRFSSFIFILVIVSLQQVYPQVTETHGNLLRINFTSPTIDLNDTLWSWKDCKYLDGSTHARCRGVIHWDSKLYLLIYSVDDNPHLPWIYNSLYDVSTEVTYQLIATQPPIDWEVYLYFLPEIRYTSQGVFLFHGIVKTANFLIDDSLCQTVLVNSMNLMHAAGQVEGKELVVANKNRYDFKYFLEELSDPANIKFNNEVIIEDSNSHYIPRPLKVQHMRDSLYLFHEDGRYLNLSSFKNNRLKLIKRLKPDEPTIWPFGGAWNFLNGNLFYTENKKLIKERFDYSSQTLYDKKVIVKDHGEDFSFSADGKLFAHITNDSLFVYSLSKEQLINSYNIKSIPHSYHFAIDSPYVYIHQILSVTVVPKEKTLPTEFVLKGNYPNPFNPSTTISFVLPKRERVTVKIFNALGQLVCDLVNGEREPGDNYLVWNGKDNFGSEAASGIYFYRVQAGKTCATGKMVLQK